MTLPKRWDELKKLNSKLIEDAIEQIIPTAFTGFQNIQFGSSFIRIFSNSQINPDSLEINSLSSQVMLQEPLQ